MGESGLQMATSVPAAVIGAAGYAGAAIGRAAGADVNPDQVQSDLANRFTYQPSVASATPGTDAAINGAVNRFVEPIAQGYGDATQSVRDQYGNFVGDAMQAAPGAFKAAGAIVPGAAGARAAVGAAARAPVTGAAPTMLEAARNVARPVTPQPVKPGMKLPPATTAEEVVARQAASSAQNMGAAAAAPNLTNVSPELKAAIVETARRNGGAINPEVLAHHVDADSLPVPVRLTEG
ncbi:MAG: hypothetical protein ACREB0_00125, partial [Sphingopyxis sp.]